MRALKGFTAIELVVTIVIAGILTSVAVASLGPLLQNRRMREAAQQVEQTIRKAQQLARTKDQMTFIRFNPPNQTSTTYTLLVGNPCGAAPTFSNTESLGQNMQILGTTLDYGNCPISGASNLNILAFNNQGNLANVGGANSVGQCIGIDDSTQDNATQNNKKGYVVCVMTASGDISSFLVDNIISGAPST